MQDTDKNKVHSLFPRDLQHLIEFDPIEKRRQFSDLDIFKRHCYVRYALSNPNLPDKWISGVSSIVTSMFRFSKPEVWIQEAVRRMDAPIYIAYTYVVLLHSLYSAHPTSKAVITDILHVLFDPDSSFDELTDYSLSCWERVPPSGLAIWALWTEVGRHFSTGRDTEVIKSAILHIAAPEKATFFHLTQANEESLIAGKKLANVSLLVDKFLADYCRLKQV